MTPDEGHIATDELLARLEAKISREYAQAAKDTQAKLDDYMRRFAVKDEIKRKQLADGKITQQEYNTWRTGQIMIGKRWEEMRDTLAQDYHNANEISRSIIHDYMPEAYAINHNYATYRIEHDSQINTSYTLYDRATVERILRDNPDLLPAPGKRMKASIAAGKDIAWQEGQIQSVTLQAILQGESIPKLAKRIAQTMGESNHKATIRYARTAITEAENAGRIDSYRRANDMGIKTRKTWLATLDNRTRHAHRDLDGQTQDVDKPFESELGEIMYPGDPAADPANVWNCRCSLLSSIEGFEKDLSDLSLRHNSHLGDMSYDEWKAEKKSMSDRITKQEEIAEGMKWRYINEDYRR